MQTRGFRTHLSRPPPPPLALSKIMATVALTFVAVKQQPRPVLGRVLARVERLAAGKWQLALLRQRRWIARQREACWTWAGRRLCR